MITFTILVIALAALLLAAALVFGLVGSVTLVVFGDAIICAVIIALIIKHFIKKRKGKG